jgi:acyl-CoA synthetase (AMP-forming)/AMP-acid ligase II
MTLLGLLDVPQQDRPALISPGDLQPTTYGELHDRVEDLAGRLAGIGVGPSSAVALVLPNGPELIELLFAVTSLGAVAAPLNPAYTRTEYDFYLADLAPDFLLLRAKELDAAREVAGRARVVDVTREDDGTVLHVPAGATRKARAPGDGAPGPRRFRSSSATSSRRHAGSPRTTSSGPRTSRTA